MAEAKLPVHGFVLAGGKSSRMGRDKALLDFRGRPMVAIAVEKLRGVCAEVSIAGNRDDLAGFAPVVHEQRLECGPAAGIEAGLKASAQPWAMFVPVDVPLVPGELLRRWAEQALLRFRDEAGVSYLRTEAVDQPAFCLIPVAYRASVEACMECGMGSIRKILERATGEKCGALWVAEAADFAGGADVSGWFLNVNTEAELAGAEEWAQKLCDGS